MDVVTAFLNPKIDRDNIYMEIPVGIDWLASSGSESSGSASGGSVLILRKALYRLKQTPRLWYEDIDGSLQSIGFQQSAEDPNLNLQPVVLLVLYGRSAHCAQQYRRTRTSDQAVAAGEVQDV